MARARFGQGRGTGQDLRRAGASVLDLQAESGWRDPRMPGRCTRALDAMHGAMARLAKMGRVSLPAHIQLA